MQQTFCCSLVLLEIEWPVLTAMKIPVHPTLSYATLHFNFQYALINLNLIELLKLLENLRYIFFL